MRSRQIERAVRRADRMAEGTRRHRKAVQVLVRAEQEMPDVLEQIIEGSFRSRAAMLAEQPAHVRQARVHDFVQRGKLVGKAKGHQRRVKQMRRIMGTKQISDSAVRGTDS